MAIERQRVINAARRQNDRGAIRQAF